MKLNFVILRSLGLLFFGIIIGGYLFRDVQPRSFLAIGQCHVSCWQPQDIAGIAASVLVQRTDWLPKIIKETDKTILIEHPNPASPLHYVAIPKKDIRNASLLSPDDQSYIDDAYALMGEVIREKNLIHWRIITNGPGYQSVSYLHFHLQAKD